MPLSPSQRDELLVRLDERSINIYQLTEKQEAHLRELNGKVASNTARSVRNEVKVRIALWALGLAVASVSSVYGILQVIH